MLPPYTWVLYLACPIQGQKEAGRLWEESGWEAPPHPTLCRPAHLHLSNLGSEERGGCASSGAAQGVLEPQSWGAAWCKPTCVTLQSEESCGPSVSHPGHDVFLARSVFLTPQPHLWKAQIRFISFLTPVYKPGAPKSVSKTLRN